MCLIGMNFEGNLSFFLIYFDLLLLDNINHSINLYENSAKLSRNLCSFINRQISLFLALQTLALLIIFDVAGTKCLTKST